MVIHGARRGLRELSLFHGLDMYSIAFICILQPTDVLYSLYTSTVYHVLVFYRVNMNCIYGAVVPTRARRLIDSCVTQLNVRGPSRTCNESEEKSVYRLYQSETLTCGVWGAGGDSWGAAGTVALPSPIYALHSMPMHFTAYACIV